MPPQKEGPGPLGVVDIHLRDTPRYELVEYGVSECDRDASPKRRPWPTGGCRYPFKRHTTI